MKLHKISRWLFVAYAVPFVFLLSIFLFQAHQQFAFTRHVLPIPQRFFQHACGLPGIGQARCHAQVVTDNNGRPLASPTLPTNAYGPVQFHTAYQLPCTPGGSVSSTCSTPANFGNGTIAIVDAYNDPTVEQDLTTYSNAYGIPLCTKANGCLTVTNQTGGTTLPTNNANWALEISLDVQIAHSICQTCKILLVEANSSSITDLGTAVNTAATLGATAISNSYGGSEWSGETSTDSYYNHPGIAVTVSSGDSGYGSEYPAASSQVIAVGGTTLQLFSDNSYASESVWNGTGSGCSKYENAPSWQISLSNWSATNCTTHRAIVDIAADADPNTGAAVYDSTPYSGQAGWWIVGGTSLASPLVASEYVLAGGVPTNTIASSLLYNNFPTAFHDITSGSNGNCTTIMCKAGIGYDGPSGLGTSIGLAAFLLNSNTPTPIPTGNPTPTPTAIPTLTPTPTSSSIDTTPPTVTITQPANNATVRRSRTTTIIAQASDNVGVTKVTFTINGTLKATKTTSPYQYNWSVPSNRNQQYTITATAYDAAGNTATSTITVTSQ